jgi:hypothetical protein
MQDGRWNKSRAYAAVTGVRQGWRIASGRQLEIITHRAKRIEINYLRMICACCTRLACRNGASGSSFPTTSTVRIVQGYTLHVLYAHAVHVGLQHCVGHRACFRRTLAVSPSCRPEPRHVTVCLPGVII